jgi:quinol-cytochrome oxidoreductase complex cytochrome b subunit
VKQQKDFYPDYLVEILLVILLTIELVILLALLYPQAIGRQIDFSTPFRPKPEWYFLWLYQLIKYFPGNSIVIGTFILPMTGILAFILIPFLDKGKWGRIKAVLSGMTLLLAFFILTILAVLNP